jgi:hypothetical protein
MTLILFVLVGLLACCLVGSMWRLIAEPDSVQVLRRAYRPMVEWLSERIVPAGFFTWVGGTSEDWELAANWNKPVGVNRFPGDGVNDDEVTFDNLSTRDCKLASNRTVAKLELAGNFGWALKLEPGKDLAVETHGFLMSGGTLNMSGDASLSLRGGTL